MQNNYMQIFVDLKNIGGFYTFSLDVVLSPSSLNYCCSVFPDYTIDAK
jgi:hypothetical protein